jgi:hypothetical protein
MITTITNIIIITTIIITTITITNTNTNIVKEGSKGNLGSL